MALSYEDYTGDGTQLDWPVPFDYINKTHVKVLVGGVLTSITSWPNVSTVRISPAVANGVAIRVYRETPKTAMVNFQNDKDLSAENLNLAIRQSRFISEEADDTADETTAVAADALETAEGAVTTANTAVTTANGAVTVANTANDKADTAVEDADDAREKAENALNLVSIAVGIEALDSDNCLNVSDVEGDTVSEALETLADEISAINWDSITGKPSFFSGAYADLSGKPTLFSGDYADLSGKPTLFSGVYADLSGKPTLGTSAAKNTGTSAGNVVEVQTGGKLPALSAADLTNVPQSCKAWINYNAQSGTINASLNVSSVTKNGTGDYTVNLATALSDAYFAVVSNAMYNSSLSWGSNYDVLVYPINSSSFRWMFYAGSVDHQRMFAAVFR